MKSQLATIIAWRELHTGTVPHLVYGIDPDEAAELLRELRLRDLFEESHELLSTRQVNLAGVQVQVVHTRIRPGPTPWTYRIYGQELADKALWRKP